jgi:hypothetical protein
VSTQSAPSGWQQRCERVAKGLETALSFTSRLDLDTAVRVSIKELSGLWAENAAHVDGCLCLVCWPHPCRSCGGHGGHASGCPGDAGQNAVDALPPAPDAKDAIPPGPDGATADDWRRTRLGAKCTQRIYDIIARDDFNPDHATDIRQCVEEALAEAELAIARMTCHCAGEMNFVATIGIGEHVYRCQDCERQIRVFIRAEVASGG